MCHPVLLVEILKMWWEIVNVLFLLLAGSVGEHCDANNQKCDPNDVVDCSRTIRLIDIGLN